MQSQSPVAEDKDVEIVMQRLREAQLPAAPAALEAATRYARELKPDGSWGDINYQDQTPGPWQTSQHLSRVVTLARAYQTPGQPQYHAADLKAKILSALDYWLQHDFRNPNWWHNQIGVPQTLGDALVLMSGDLSTDELTQGLKIMGRSSWTDQAGKPVTWTGANLVWIAGNRVVLGCLAQSPDIVAEAFSKIFNEIRVAPQGEEGIQTDYSFHQHGDVLYSGGYGAAFTSSTSSFVDYARGTRFAVDPERLNVLVNYVLDGQQWMIRGGTWDYGVIGREITRAGHNARGLASATERMAKIPGPRQAELALFARRLRGADGDPLVGNRDYPQSDFMVQHRPGYYTSARMFSTRTLNTDGYINSEGKKSHHIADGANFLFRTGDEYRDIFPVWDWQRVPGTTVEQSPVPLDPKHVQSRGKTTFVGGVSDRTYGLAAMDLARDNLSTHKSWFFFDDEYVCLGAGIHDTSDNPVLTSINQCLLHGPVEVSTVPQPLAAGDHDLSDTQWVLHDGVGYFFPGKAHVHVGNHAQTGAWSDIGAGSAAPVSKDVFSLWLDHGAKPDGAGYAYIVVPNTTRVALEARSRDTNVEILSNTAALQAVRHKGLKRLGAAFYQPGHLDGGPGWNVTVDQSCLLMLHDTGAGLELSVANPEHKALTVNVELDRPLQGADVTAAPGVSRFRVVLPGGAEAGRSVVHTLMPR